MLTTFDKPYTQNVAINIINIIQETNFSVLFVKMKQLFFVKSYN